MGDKRPWTDEQAERIGRRDRIASGVNPDRFDDMELLEWTAAVLAVEVDRAAKAS